jgi:hypothetical protein
MLSILMVHYFSMFNIYFHVVKFRKFQLNIPLNILVNIILYLLSNGVFNLKIMKKKDLKFHIYMAATVNSFCVA